MKDSLPILTILGAGLFGLFGIEASEEQIAALITGLVMAGASVWAIYKANKK